jgi:hypothetical protein
MTAEERAGREQLITRILSARSIEEIDAAEAALAAGLQIHPADVGMEDGFEQLTTMREAAEAEHPAHAVPAGVAEGGATWFTR